MGAGASIQSKSYGEIKVIISNWFGITNLTPNIIENDLINLSLEVSKARCQLIYDKVDSLKSKDNKVDRTYRYMIYLLDDFIESDEKFTVVRSIQKNDTITPVEKENEIIETEKVSHGNNQVNNEDNNKDNHEENNQQEQPPPPPPPPPQQQEEQKQKEEEEGGPYGVTLQFLHHFIDKYNIPQSMTTAEVVREIIIPETISTKQTFLDGKLKKKYSHYWSDLRKGHRRFEGRKQYVMEKSFEYYAFVSHSWAIPFHILVKSLTSSIMNHWQSTVAYFILYEDVNEVEDYSDNVFLWIDIFCKNQHIPSPAMEEFYIAMKTPESVVAVFYPSINPSAISRIWCLFELFTAIKFEISTIIANVDNELYKNVVTYYESQDTSKNNRDPMRFEKLGVDKMIECLKQFIAVDVEKAQATVPADIDLILGLIHESVGVDEMNQMIYKFLIKNIIQKDFLNLVDRSPGCFGEDSIVTIESKGNIPVNLVSIGDKILTDTGKYEPIELITIDEISNGYLEMCYTNEGVYMTPEHPIYDKDTNKWILPKDIYEVKKYSTKRVYNIELKNGNAIYLNNSLIVITLGHNLDIDPETDKLYGWGWKNNPNRLRKKACETISL